MLRIAARPVSKQELTNWCFLLGHETQSRGGKSYYQFVPHNYGPFSFCLNQETTTLARKGFLEEIEGKSLQLIKTGNSNGEKLALSIKKDVELIVRRFAGQPIQKLVHYVCQHYPWFTINRKKEKLLERPAGKLAIYTAGYEGLSVDGFLDMLTRHGIRQLIDVRKNPVARRYGFHKSTLMNLCQSLAIEYFHFPELGIPSSERRGLQTEDDYISLFDRYKKDILKNEGTAVSKVSELMRKKPSTLMCMEALPYRCHRLLVARAAARRTGLPIEHLETAQ